MGLWSWRPGPPSNRHPLTVTRGSEFAHATTFMNPPIAIWPLVLLGGGGGGPWPRLVVVVVSLMVVVVLVVVVVVVAFFDTSRFVGVW